VEITESVAFMPGEKLPIGWLVNCDVTQWRDWLVLQERSVLLNLEFSDVSILH
jgi:hypothetical protein